MKFTVSMMRDYVATDLDAQGLGDLLTMAGFELEDIVELGEGDAVLDIKVMSNRGDGLSVYGLAREVRAKLGPEVGTSLFDRAWSGFSDVVVGSERSELEIRLESEKCDRFSGVEINHVRNGESPDWLRSRLEKVGMRSISLLVDLTNYVMLEIGQPLHAYDLGKLGRTIVVREAKSGEQLTTLDEVERSLTEGQLMICDASRPVGVAGVMGGFDTEVDSSTTHIVLEAAHFLNTSVRKTRKQLGLNTEASYRFERSVDPELVAIATRRFIELLRIEQPEIQVLAPVEVSQLWSPRTEIYLDLDRANRLLGMRITSPEAERYLTLLGFEVLDQDPLRVSVPTWRPDVVREEDVIEELGRVHGYERIPEELPAGKTVMAGVLGAYRAKDRVVEAFVQRGYTQCVSHSLRALHPLDGSAERIGPRNPGSPELAYLRCSLLPGLAEAAARNGGREFFLFEVGQVFERQNSATSEFPHLAVLANGAILPANRAKDPVVPADVYQLKSDLEYVLESIRAEVRWSSAPDDARFHAGRAAVLVDAEGQSVGVAGQIHPWISEELGLPESTVMAEIWLDRILSIPPEPTVYRPISRNPAVRRDIAVVLDQSVPFSDIESAILNSGCSTLESHGVFDVYAGPGIPEGKHSLGIALQFRKMGANLTDEEANQERDLIVKALEALGGQLR